MAAGYSGEEDLWNCLKHPSNRRRTGVCAACLRDRLACLCPHCANLRPCACAAASSSGRLYKAEKPPSFRRSASLTAPFLRFKTSDRPATKTTSFLAVLRRSRANKREAPEEDRKTEIGSGGGRPIEDFARMVTRSRSPAKGKFWHFPGPMKAFRNAAKASNDVVQERSPLHRD